MIKLKSRLYENKIGVILETSDDFSINFVSNLDERIELSRWAADLILDGVLDEFNKKNICVQQDDIDVGYIEYNGVLSSYLIIDGTKIDLSINEIIKYIVVGINLQITKGIYIDEKS
jgi:hypothetical protein